MTGVSARIGRLAGFCMLPFVLGLSPAKAQSLSEIYHLAAKTEPEYQKAKEDNKATREKLKQAFTSLYPRVAFNYDYTRVHQNVLQSGAGVFTNGASTFDTNEGTLRLTQPVFALGSYTRISQAKIEVDRTVVSMEEARQQLLLTTATRYLEALSIYDVLSLTVSEEEALTRHLELAEGRITSGLGRVTDLHDARARLEAVRARRIEGQNKLKDALEALGEICGQVPTALARLSPRIPLVRPDPGDQEIWVQAALRQNLSVAIQRHTVGMAEQGIETELSARMPTVNLTGRDNRRNSGGSLFGGGSDVATQDVLVSLEVPMFDGGLYKARAQEAVYQKRIAKEELTKRTRAAVRETRSGYSGILGAISKVEALAQSVESQNLALDSKKTGLDNGLNSIVQVLDAERDLFQAKYEFAQARYDYVINSLRLKKAVGTLSEADLNRVNTWLEPIQDITKALMPRKPYQHPELLVAKATPDAVVKLPQFHRPVNVPGLPEDQGPSDFSGLAPETVEPLRQVPTAESMLNTVPGAPQPNAPGGMPLASLSGKAPPAPRAPEPLIPTYRMPKILFRPARTVRAPKAN